MPNDLRNCRSVFKQVLAKFHSNNNEITPAKHPNSEHKLICEVPMFESDIEFDIDSHYAGLFLVHNWIIILIV